MEFLPFLLSFTAGIVAGHLACKYLSHRTAGAYIVRSPTAFREASEGWSFVRKLSCRGTAFSESPSQTTGLHLQVSGHEVTILYYCHTAITFCCPTTDRATCER